MRDLGCGVVVAFHIVDAVAVVTDRFVGGLVGRLALKQRYRRAVEIGHVGVEDVGGDVVFAH